MGFPNSTDFQSNYFAYNRWSTTLVSDITPSTTVIPLQSVTGLPDKGWVSANFEVIYYDYIDYVSKTLGSVTYPVTRAADNNSVASSHSAGSQVQQRINAAAFNQLMGAVRKNNLYQITPTTIAANTESEQNITSFASRADIHKLMIIPNSNIEYFRIGLYKTDQFKAIDRVWQSDDLYPVRTTVSSASSGDTLNVSSIANIFVDAIVALGNPFTTGEFAVVKEVDSGNTQLVFYDDMANSYTDEDVSLVFIHNDSFYYQDNDWTAELHAKIENLDPAITLNLQLQIEAEISDE